jgi:hypothetical protein
MFVTIIFFLFTVYLKTYSRHSSVTKYEISHIDFNEVEQNIYGIQNVSIVDPRFLFFANLQIIFFCDSKFVSDFKEKSHPLFF